MCEFFGADKKDFNGYLTEVEMKNALKLMHYQTDLEMKNLSNFDYCCCGRKIYNSKKTIRKKIFENVIWLENQNGVYPCINIGINEIVKKRPMRMTLEWEE